MLLRSIILAATLLLVSANFTGILLSVQKRANTHEKTAEELIQNLNHVQEELL